MRVINRIFDRVEADKRGGGGRVCATQRTRRPEVVRRIAETLVLCNTSWRFYRTVRKYKTIISGNLNSRAFESSRTTRNSYLRFQSDEPKRKFEFRKPI